jgi:hypothetical protein
VKIVFKDNFKYLIVELFYLKFVSLYLCLFHFVILYNIESKDFQFIENGSILEHIFIVFLCYLTIYVL